MFSQATMGRSRSRTMKYRIALLRSDEGYSVSVPGLPGCCSQGATEQEAVQNIRVAIQEYLASATSSSGAPTSSDPV